MFNIFKTKDKFTKEQIERLTQRLMKEEGFRSESYWDLKQWTVGYGTPAPGKHFFITKEDAKKELAKEVKRSIKEYDWVRKRCPFRINEVRREALTDMIFNMGMPTFKKFEETLKLIFNDNNYDWWMVAAEARDSKWYKQVGDRAKRICFELDTGLFYENLERIIKTYQLGKSNE